MGKRVLIPSYCLVGIYQESDELSCATGMYPHCSLVDGVSGGPDYAAFDLRPIFEGALVDE